MSAFAGQLCKYRTMRSIHRHRRHVLGLTLAGFGGAVLRVACAAPAHNLLVSLRVADDDASLGGAGGPAVTVHSARAGRSTEQSVLVLNGARAAIRLVQGMPVDDIDVVWTPWGPGGAVRSRWVELVDGLQVRPSWPGGNAPVTVELAIDRTAPGARTRPGAVPAQWSVLSTVQAPLDEWVAVAQLQARQARAAVTTGGFGASTRSRQRVLQLRVSLA